MSTQVQIAPRLDRKAVIFDPRVKESIAKKIQMMSAMEIDAVLRSSHALRNTGAPLSVWVTNVGDDLRLIFRRTGPASIEVIDVATHEDLDKFAFRQS
jgi:hypothetical protein